MRIKGVVCQEVEGDFPTIEDFNRRYPNAIDIKINGWADGICEKGHLFREEVGCRECPSLCRDCLKNTWDCDCVPF